MNRRSPLRALAALAPHAPRTVDAAIRAIARATYGRVGVTIDREDLRRLMPELSPGEADAVSRQAWLNHVRFLTLRPSRLRDRRDFVREALVDDGGLSRISGPAVLALIHTGPFFILEEALRRVPAPVAVLLMGDAPPGDGNLTFHTSVGDGHGMRAFLGRPGHAQGRRLRRGRRRRQSVVDAGAVVRPHDPLARCVRALARRHTPMVRSCCAGRAAADAWCSAIRSPRWRATRRAPRPSSAGWRPTCAPIRRRSCTTTSRPGRRRFREPGRRVIGSRLLDAAGEVAARAPRVAYAAAGPLAQPFRPWGRAALDPEEVRSSSRSSRRGRPAPPRGSPGAITPVPACSGRPGGEEAGRRSPRCSSTTAASRAWTRRGSSSRSTSARGS